MLFLRACRETLVLFSNKRISAYNTLLPVYSSEDYVIELLVENGYIAHDRLNQVRSELGFGESVLDHLIKTGELSEEVAAQTCAHQAGMAYVNIDELPPSSEVVSIIDEETARRFHAVCLGDDGLALTVAVADPLSFEVLDSLPQMVGREINFVCAKPSSIENLMNASYTGGTSVNGAEDEYTGEGDAPIIRLVTQTLLDAFKLKASDIHIEPMEDRLRVRFRMDGKLIETATYPKKLLGPIIARLKVMSGTMSIAEKRLPQDGRIQMMVTDKQVDLRVSSVPTNHGESIVMRILDKSALVLGLPQLGFFSDDEDIFEHLITLPDGIILVTGPTGSGKTTTLYACLNHINRPDKKIITVEDPVEYELSGINQVMVKADIGMTFAAALRAMLRQAPNIIMLGEIRDEETANIAINASLTGHLVFSTLHTNDAPSAVARLADMGIKRFLIASAVRAVMAQRLVRKLCDKCKTPATLTQKQAQGLNLDLTRVTPGAAMTPVGCDTCRNKGFKGRMGLFEVFQIDDEVRHMINENLTTPQLRRRARELGMRTLREDGVRKVLSGLTSADEVINVTMGDFD